LLIYLTSKAIALIAARTGEDVTEAVMADQCARPFSIQGVLLAERGYSFKLRVPREDARKKSAVRRRHAYTHETLPRPLERPRGYQGDASTKPQGRRKKLH
jgi:hypothetical protein